MGTAGPGPPAFHVFLPSVLSFLFILQYTGRSDRIIHLELHRPTQAGILRRFYLAYLLLIFRPLPHFPWGLTLSAPTYHLSLRPAFPVPQPTLQLHQTLPCFPNMRTSVALMVLEWPLSTLICQGSSIRIG